MTAEYLLILVSLIAIGILIIAIYLIFELIKAKKINDNNVAYIKLQSELIEIYQELQKLQNQIIDDQRNALKECGSNLDLTWQTDNLYRSKREKKKALEELSINNKKGGF
ncbi:MAG: hypothetical protein LUC25_01090 [Ruminococcus sp.]|nr:hypothetical protein [Ruminococcus sp.]